MTKIKKIKRSIKMCKYFFISVNIFIMLIIFATIFWKYCTGKEGFVEKVTLTIILLILLVMFCLACWLAYEKLIKKQYEYEIQNEKLKQIIPKEYGLIEGSFTQVYLSDEDSEGIYEKNTREKLEAKYFAKLISYDEIEVILKDRDGDLLHKPKKINNFVYFKEHYKPL